ncbi:hypothetical protein CWS54_16990 [Klebsiella michiganensis]|nr:hypothetical protein [Klebsiella michiganensis]MBX4661624.1 hypothetical protein [Klebsiella michiganensis]
MNIKTVNELIQSLESAGELSIKERKYLDVMRWAVRVAGERDAALNAERVWERAMMEVCGEDGPASVASEIRALQVLRDTRIQALNSQVEQLAAENVALKAERVRIFNSGYLRGHESTVEWYYVDIHQDDITTYHEGVVAEISEEKTPATDRIVAGIKADGVEEFAKHCDDSIGFVEPEDEEFYAVMEEHASEFAKQLREGADK